VEGALKARVARTIELGVGKSLRLRRDDACVVCGAALPAGRLAVWDAAARTVTCTMCDKRIAATDGGGPGIARYERGQPGASAAREHDRRRRSREARTRADHPVIGGLLLALGGAPQHEDAFRRGAAAERAVADSLERRTATSDAILLHDRRMPNGRANIDHLAIAANGVYVIDAKAHHGKVSVSTPLFGAPKLRIAGRDRTGLLDGLDRQVAVVRATLDAGSHRDVPIQGVLCFTNADLPLLATLRIRGHLLLYRKALAKRINAQRPLTEHVRTALAHTLTASLHPA
jgi:Nuclease-related domain